MPPADHELRMIEFGLRSMGFRSETDSASTSLLRNSGERNSIRAVASCSWQYTDDTEMALAIADVLGSYAEIDQDRLAQNFARRFGINPYRGYGSGAIEVLQAIEAGRPGHGGSGAILWARFARQRSRHASCAGRCLLCW